MFSGIRLCSVVSENDYSVKSDCVKISAVSRSKCFRLSLSGIQNVFSSVSGITWISTLDSIDSEVPPHAAEGAVG